MSDPLTTYLHDHLAGAAFAIDLLEAMKGREQDKPLSRFAGDLLIEVKQDRDTLQQLADKVGSGPNVVKELGAWLGEKASRVKLGGVSGEFGTFEALEFLASGVHGKLNLWHALEVAAASDARLRDLDFEQLIRRAEGQHARVEERRLAAAATALRAPRS